MSARLLSKLGRLRLSCRVSLCHKGPQRNTLIRHKKAAAALVQPRHSYCVEAKDQEEKTTHFGYETVYEDEKEDRVYEVFHNVAEKYDQMNDVMSGGVHRLWKDYFIEQMGPTAGTQLLDLAGGTGDIALRFLKYVDNQQEEENIQIPRAIQAQIYMDPAEQSDEDLDVTKTHVTVCDINQAMLDVGEKRLSNLGITQGISWIQGNAEKLPFADNSFDFVSMAFGIRNCTHPDRVLSEAFRVLKPQGRFMCLEFSRVPNPVIRALYDEYSFQVIPVMGQIIAGDYKSYRYLVESIRRFPSQEDFAAMFGAAGFKAVNYENLMMGVAAIHSGFKL